MSLFFKEIKPDDISESVFKLIAEDRFLLTAGILTMSAVRIYFVPPHPSRVASLMNPKEA